MNQLFIETINGEMPNDFSIKDGAVFKHVLKVSGFDDAFKVAKFLCVKAETIFEIETTKEINSTLCSEVNCKCNSIEGGKRGLLVYNAFSRKDSGDVIFIPYGWYLKRNLHDGYAYSEETIGKALPFWAFVDYVNSRSAISMLREEIMSRSDESKAIAFDEVAKTGLKLCNDDNIIVTSTTGTSHK